MHKLVNMIESIKVYSYKKCSTCIKALRYLESKSVNVECLPIRDTPPTYAELEHVLEKTNLELKQLFNVSGMDYRALNMKEKLPNMSKKDALELLSKHGNLIKRPFLVSNTFGLVGFKQEQWDKYFLA